MNNSTSTASCQASYTASLAQMTTQRTALWLVQTSTPAPIGPEKSVIFRLVYEYERPNGERVNATVRYYCVLFAPNVQRIKGQIICW